MTKREKLLETLNYFNTGKHMFYLLFVVEKDPKHDNAFNFIIKDEFESDTIEPGVYNIAVLDDSVCFHRFAVRGSVFMYFSDDEDTLFNKEVEYASTHEGLLQSLKSTKTIIEFIIDLLERDYSNANWDHIEMLKNLKFNFCKGETDHPVDKETSNG